MTSPTSASQRELELQSGGRLSNPGLGEAAEEIVGPQHVSADNSEQEERSSSGAEEANILDIGPEIQTSSGIIYDVRHLNPRSRAQAAAGINGEFDVHRCTEASHQRFYDFEFDKLIHVRVGMSADIAPECNCTAYMPGLACKHVYHIGHEIVVAVGNVDRPLTLEPDGRSIQGRPLPELIGRRTIQSIAEAQDWGFRKLFSSIVRHDGPGTFRNRTDNLQDMISVYEPNDALPEDFRNEVHRATTPPARQELSVSYRRFADVVINLALTDDDLFTGLRDILTPTLCAKVFYVKIRNRVDQALMRLDEEATGLATEQAQERRFTINQCALALHEYIADVKANEYRNAVSEEAANHFAGTLIDILARVVDRNRDIYDDVHGRTTPAGETEADRNLYLRMIGSAPAAKRLDAVVMDALRGLGQDVMRNHEDRLEGIKEDIREHDAGQGAPRREKRQLDIGSEAAGSPKRRSRGRG